MKQIFFLMLFSTNIIAQQIGFTIETTSPIMNKNFDLGLFMGISGTAGIRILSDLNIEGRGGYNLTINSFYKGWNYSAYLIYDFKKPFYIIAGYNHHSNEGWGSNKEGIAEENINMVGLGGGIKTSQVFSVELIYHKLLKNKPWHYLRDIHTFEPHWENLHSVIKVNFKFLWQL